MDLASDRAERCKNGSKTLVGCHRTALRRPMMAARQLGLRRELIRASSGYVRRISGYTPNFSLRAVSNPALGKPKTFPGLHRPQSNELVQFWPGLESLLQAT